MWDLTIKYQQLLKEGFTPKEDYPFELTKTVGDSAELLFLFDLELEKPIKRDLTVRLGQTNLATVEDYIDSHTGYLLTPMCPLPNGAYKFVVLGANDGHGMLFICDYVEGREGNYLSIEHRFPRAVRNGVYKGR